jgi:hypothetical protein
MPRLIRRRGAALVEFALVGPVFILMLFMIIQISVWAYDRETLMVATRAGARAAVIGPSDALVTSPGAAEVSRIFGGRVEVVTPALPVTAPVFATAGSGPCLQSRNAAGDVYTTTVHARLGWDWGCFPDAAALVRAPLETGIRTVAEVLHGGGAIWIGPHGDATIEACYIVIAPVTGAESCPYRLTASIGSDGVLGPISGGFTGSLTTTPAPSLIRISARSTAPTLVGATLLGVDALSLEGAGAFWIDRFRPPCPPLTDRRQYETGTCGGVH